MKPTDRFIRIIKQPAVQAVCFFLVAALQMAGQNVGISFLNYLRGNHSDPNFGQTDLIPVIVAAHLYNADKLSTVYAHFPYLGINNQDWVAVEKALPNSGDGKTAYSYAPIYLVPLAWLVRTVDYYDVIVAMAVLNFVIALIVLVWFAIWITDDWLVRLLIVSTFALSYTLAIPIYLGQNYLLTLLSTAGFILCYFQRRIALGTAFFLLATTTKPWGAVLILVPLLRRDYRETALLLLTLLVFFGGQYLWEPQLVRGYVDQMTRHQAVTLLTWNNASLSAALHRLSLVGASGPWREWQTLNHAGAAPLVVVRTVLAAAVLLVGWIARRNELKVHSVFLALFVLGNIFWDFYTTLLVPLAVSSLLALQPTTRSSTIARSAVGGAYLIALSIGANWRPLMGPWSDPATFSPDTSAFGTIRSLIFLLIAAIAIIAAFPRHRIAALLLGLTLIVMSSIPTLLMFEVPGYLAGAMSARGVKLANALITCIPASLFLSCFVLQCRRENVFGQGWRHQLLSFQPGTS